jgi:uncharacterized protein with FMN-binding domain
VRRAVPTIVLTAAGLTWLLRAPGVIDTDLHARTLTPGADAAASTGPGAAAPVTGPVVTTQYGPVQVAAVIRSGRLDDVLAFQVPDGDANSKRIAALAIPVLQRAAITAQSARIDSVAGATFTSSGYRDSLQGALDRAGFAPSSRAGEQAAGTTSTTEATIAPGGTVPGTTPPPGPAAGNPPAPTTTAARSGATAPRTTTPPPPPSTKPVVPAGPKNGTFAGPAVNQRPMFFGTVTVTVTIAGGRITNVSATAPTESLSGTINPPALATLRTEVLSAQSAKAAKVATVSGATSTSNAYRDSLQAALDQAGFTG